MREFSPYYTCNMFSFVVSNSQLSFSGPFICIFDAQFCNISGNIVMQHKNLKSLRFVIPVKPMLHLDSIFVVITVKGVQMLP